MKSFSILVGTFALVYVLTPLVVDAVMRWLPVEHPERAQNGFAILATIVVYSVLRRVMGKRMPPI